MWQLAMHDAATYIQDRQGTHKVALYSSTALPAQLV